MEFRFRNRSSRIILPRGDDPICFIVKLEATMSETEMKDLIDRLQRVNRRWKIIALVSTSILAVLLLVTGASSVVLWKRAEAEREMAMKMYRETMARSEQLQREAAEMMDALEAPKEVDRAKKE